MKKILIITWSGLYDLADMITDLLCMAGIDYSVKLERAIFAPAGYVAREIDKL